MKTKDPKPVHDAKAMARSLRDALAARNVALSHSECLEIVARQFGYIDWNTLSAKLSIDTPAPQPSGESAVPVPTVAATLPPMGTSPAWAPAPAPGATFAGMPVLPLRDVVVYPGVVIPLYAARPKTLRAMEAAQRGEKRALLLTQRRTGDEDPQADDLYGIGTLGSVVEVLQLPNGTWKILVSGIARASVAALRGDGYLSANITVLGERPAGTDIGLQALRQRVSARFERYAARTGWPHIPGRVESDAAVRVHILASFALLEDGRYADTIAAHLRLPLAEKQHLLEMLEVRKRLEHVEGALAALEAELPPDPREPHP